MCVCVCGSVHVNTESIGLTNKMPSVSTAITISTRTNNTLKQKSSNLEKYLIFFFRDTFTTTTLNSNNCNYNYLLPLLIQLFLTYLLSQNYFYCICFILFICRKYYTFLYVNIYKFMFIMLYLYL